MNLPLDDLFNALRGLGSKVVYVRAMERKKDQETDQVAHVTNDVGDPVLQAFFETVAPEGAARTEQICDALRELIESYCDVPEPMTVRVHVYTHKSVRLRTFTVRSQATLAERAGAHQAALLPDPPLRIDNVDDLLTQRLIATMQLQQTHVERMSNNYQALFDLTERILAKVAGLMEQRAARAERHALDLLDKRIAEKRLELDLTAGERKKEGEVAVKEKAIETAGNVVEKLLGGVLSMVGIDPSALGGLGSLAKVIEADPELKAAVSDPSALAAFSDPEVRGVITNFLKNYKKVSPEDATEA
jgi:hypothetical protein